jgi:hypothetical protein
MPFLKGRPDVKSNFEMEKERKRMKRNYDSLCELLGNINRENILVTEV